MSERRVLRQVALGAVQLFLITTASLSLAAIAKAQDETEPPEPAALTLEMAADPMTFGAVGEVITYEYFLINNGGVALDDLTVTDTLVKDVLCESGPLEPGGSLVCEGSWAITQRALHVAAEVNNIAQASGTYGGGEVVESEEADLTITALVPEPAALTLEMAADPMTFGAVGEVITYEYFLINNGGVALDDLTVTDTLVKDVLCESGPLEPGGSLVCEGSWAITQRALHVAEVTNIAQASGTYGGGEVVESEEADLTITALATEPAALTLEMAADPMTFGAVGEVITYEYFLINNGGVALDDLTVTDTLVKDVLCESGPLEPGGSLVCEGSWAITQRALDVAAEVTNIAQASGTYGGGEVVESDEADLTITALATEPAALTLEMSPGVTTFGAVGEVIGYVYLLTNTGGVALDAVFVIDTRVAAVLCPPGPVEPGGALACLGAYTITQADLDAGSVTHRAYASGTYGGGGMVASDEAIMTITALATEPAALRLEMAAEGGVTTFSAVGEEIGYIYLLTNTGGVALGDLTVIPSLGPVTCPSEPLEPDGAVLCVGAYAITQADLDAGSVTNRAQASGTYGGSGGVASEEASLTITALAQEPAALTLELGSVATTFSAVDDRIEYDYVLTNTGGVVLDAVSVNPELGDVVCPSVSLRPDGAVLCVGYYYITQADLDAGSVTNRAQASGTYGQGEGVASESVSLTITAVAAAPAALRLELESVATTFSAVDDRIEFDYLLTNTGGVALDAVSVNPKLGDVVCTPGPLRPGGAVLCVGYYYITQADLDAGSVTNTAQGEGTYGKESVASEEASLTITAVTP